MQKDTDIVLSIRNVSKSFGSNKAVDDVDIEVQSGEIFGFLGPNGAGKSTTIRLILDLLRPDSGTITIMGSTNRSAKTVHKDIGFLSGDMALDTDLTGRQYLEFINSLHGGQYNDRIASLAETLEVKLDVKIGTYSRGNRQKIGLIAALLHQPKLLILDEPTSGFDPLVQERFAALLRQYVKDGGTVLMSSHILGEVQHLCDRVAFIKNGRIITTKSVSELLETGTKQVQAVAAPGEITKITAAITKLTGLSLIVATKTTVNMTYSGEISPLISFLTNYKLIDLTIREPELEEIFSGYYETSTREANHA